MANQKYVIIGIIVTIIMSIIVISEYSQTDTPQLEFKDNGNFFVTHMPNPNSPYTGFEVASAYLQEIPILDYEADFLNGQLQLPHDIEVIAMECNKVNSYYVADTKQIIICYEYLDRIFEVYDYYHEDDGSRYEYAYDVIVGTFYHEVAHALIDVYDLPITGSEEIVADQFTAYMLNFIYEEDTSAGPRMILHNGYSYYLNSLIQEEFDSGKESLAYHNTHGLDEQRKFNFYCWGYGIDPVKYEYVVTDGFLPIERAVSCEEEFNTISNTWAKLLDEHDNGFFDPENNIVWDPKD